MCYFQFSFSEIPKKMKKIWGFSFNQVEESVRWGVPSPLSSAPVLHVARAGSGVESSLGKRHRGTGFKPHTLYVLRLVKGLG